MLDPNLSPRGARRATLATLFLAASLSTSMQASGADASAGPAAAADGKSITPVPTAKIEAEGVGAKTVSKHKAVTPPRPLPPIGTAKAVTPPRPLTDARVAASAPILQPIDSATGKAALVPMAVPPKGK